jgi:hypothetical protein
MKKNDKKKRIRYDFCIFGSDFGTVIFDLLDEPITFAILLLF